MFNGTHVGQPRPRVDGALKVTGRAKYAADFSTNDLLHCAVVCSPVAKGRVRRLDASRAEAFPGVVKVFTHENRPRTAWFDRAWKDQIGPPGSPFRPLYDEKILFAMQPVALVVATEWGIARHAASLVEVECDAETPTTDLKEAQRAAYEPPKQRSGIAPPPKPRGDFKHGMASGAARVRETYEIHAEHHAAMEPHATTVIVKEGGKLLIHDKTQGVQNVQATVASVFGLSKSDVHVVTPFLGGGFGSGLRPATNLFLAVMAALDLGRSVRLALHRDQVFAMTHHRPESFVTAGVAATPEGRLTALEMDAIAATSTYEDHQEVVVNWPGHLYEVENAAFGYRLAKLDTHSPGDQRAPGAPLGMFAAESAMDELAHKLGMDPLDLRLANIAEENDLNDGKPFTSKELRAAIQVGAERFGWRNRSPEPRSMREGRELIGYGMAIGVWEAQTAKHAAAITLHRDGRAEVRCATSDLGTGTYTILAQIAADALGLPMEAVSVRLGDSDLPPTPPSAGSWTAASAGTAVQQAAAKICAQLFQGAQRMQGSPVYGANVDEVRFRDGRIVLARDPSRGVAVLDALEALGEEKLEAEVTALPNPITKTRYSSYAHSAVFAEVRLDEELLVPRVARITCAVAAGRILNPRTARSQIIGGVVWGIGQALHEEALFDHALGRQMNHNLAEYHLPVNADVPPVEVCFVDERDDKTSPIGVKGLGEIGIVGTAAAIANAIFHATGRRVRGLPITPDRVLFG